MKDLTNLRKTAEAVKQEPWVLAGGNEWISPIGITVDYDNGGVSPVEAEFIATFDPPTVLALITRLEQAEAAVARVRELAESWKSRGEHDMEYSKTIPPNIGEIINECGAEMVHKANLIYRALDGEQG